MTALRQTILLGSNIQETEIVKFVYNACHMWSEKHPERASELLDENVKEHVWGATGPEEMTQVCLNTHRVFQDFQLTIDDVVCEGDLQHGKISCRFSARGKWVTDHCGIPANNKFVTVPGIFFWNVESSKIKESWIYQSFEQMPDLGAALLRDIHARRFGTEVC